MAIGGWDGEEVNYWVFLIGFLIFISGCIEEKNENKGEVSCNMDSDCILGLKCGHLCYNKNYQKWYEENVSYCLWDYPIEGTTCECVNGTCKAKFPPKCGKNEDCPEGLYCVYGYCQPKTKGNESGKAGNKSEEEFDFIFEGSIIEEEAKCGERFASTAKIEEIIKENEDRKEEIRKIPQEELTFPYKTPLNLSKGDVVLVKCKGEVMCVDFPNPNDPYPCQMLSGGCGYHCTSSVVEVIKRKAEVKGCGCGGG